MAEPRVLVTGSNGKLGRVLRQVWGQRADMPRGPVWQVRGNAGARDLLWDIDNTDYSGPDLAGGAILHLAGGRADLAGNSRLALKICEMAARQRVAHVFLASSSAVYAADEVHDLSEDTPPAPMNPYGAAKLQMERDVAAWLVGRAGPGVTFLRIGNVLGSDGLIGGAVPGRKIGLTPVPGREGGPMRSYVGPESFARILGQLCGLGMQRVDLPPVLNLGLAPPVTMAALLEAAGLDWAYSAPGDEVISRLVLDVRRLSALVPMQDYGATPAAMVAEWRALRQKASA